METFNVEGLTKKVSLGMELATKKAEKKQQLDQQKPAGTLKTKAKVAPRSSAPMRGDADISASAHVTSTHPLVGAKELRNSLSGKIVVLNPPGVPVMTVEITLHQDWVDGDDSLLG